MSDQDHKLTRRDFLKVAGAAGVVVGVGGGLTGLAACGGGGTSTTSSPTNTKPQPLTDVQIADKLKPSTVQVFGRQGDSYVGGTGFLYDKAKGLVLTNAHVIAGLATITVRHDEDEATGIVVGQAPCEDIAVVKMESVPPDMREAELARTARNVRSGQRVTALGYPESFQSGSHPRVTVTSGTVSVDGLIGADPSSDLPHYDAVIQHGATLNHGNSGGPLVDQFGRVIGINTLGNTGQNGEVQGQYYAIAIDHVREFLPQLEAGHDIGYVGWDLFPYAALVDQYDYLQKAFGWQYKPNSAIGLIVLGVDPGSLAEKHNFRAGDWFYRVNDVSVDTVAELDDIIKSNLGRQINVKGTVLTDNSQYKEGIQLPAP